MSLAQRLNKRVRIEQKDTDPPADAMGQPIETWIDFITDTSDNKVWAEIKDLSAREFISAGAMQGTVQTKITIRYRSGITRGMRVVYGSDIFSIEGDPLGQDGRTLLLMCKRFSV